MSNQSVNTDITETSKYDDVNRPEHYTQGGIECIDYLKAKLTPEQFEGYLKGNTLKYISRCEIKGNKLTDLRKAQWYLDKLISEFEDQKINAASLFVCTHEDLLL